jgi:hypothetical protein
MSENKITYLELPSNDVSALKTFYGQLFGWTFQDYGDDYAAVEGGGLEGGFNGDPASKSKAPRDVFPLGRRERSRRTPTNRRNYPAALRQQEPNGTVALAEGTSNLMQRLSRLPTAAHVGPLLSGEPIPFSLGHEHHL